MCVLCLVVGDLFWPNNAMTCCGIQGKASWPAREGEREREGRGECARLTAKFAGALTLTVSHFSE